MFKTNRKSTFYQRVILLATVVLSAIPCTAPAAQKTFILTAAEVSGSGAAVLSLNFDLSAAQVTIVRSTDEKTIVRAEVVYSDTQREPTFTAGSDNTTFSATFSSGLPASAETDAPEQHWTIALGPSAVPTDLSLSCAAVTGAADFGGLLLRSWVVLCQKSTLTFDWSSPVPAMIQVAIVAASASSLTLQHLGNARCDAAGVLCSTTEVRCNLSGSLSEGNHTMTIMMLGGNADLVIPASVAAAVTARSFFSRVSVAGDGWKQRYRLPMHQGYVTDDYLSQTTMVTFDMTALGSQILITRESR